MVHLDALSLTYKECLMNGIGSIGTIAPVGMPAGVGSGCLRAVGLCVIPRLFTVALYQRSTPFTANLQCKQLGVVTVGRMAIETAARQDMFR